MSPEALETALRAVGPERYHDLHPFHDLLHGGKLNKGQVQAWALNRYVYQAAIPRKDASLMGRCDDRELRREWLHRITDHDGFGEDKGGIERWLILTDGLGLDRDYVISQEGALPATKFAVEAYVAFRAREAAARSRGVEPDRAVRAVDPPPAHRRHAGELRLHRREGGRLFPPPARPGAEGRGFRPRLRQEATRARSSSRRASIAALTFKTEVLWAQLDALHHAYVCGAIPPGAFRPE